VKRLTEIKLWGRPRIQWKLAAEIYNVVNAAERPLTTVEVEEATGRGKGLLKDLLTALVKDEWLVERDNPFANKRGGGHRGCYAREFIPAGREWPQGFWCPGFREIEGRFVVVDAEDLESHGAFMASVKAHNATRRAA
jgi:hypothetical protein